MKFTIRTVVTSVVVFLVVIHGTSSSPLQAGGVSTAISGEKKDEKVKKNYLPSVLKTMRSSQGTEKRFFEAQQNNPDLGLLENLGLLQTPELRPFGSVTHPGTEPFPTFFDQGEVKAINYRKRLAWDFTFGRQEDTPILLVFDKHLHSWPGSQPLTIVLLDAQFKVLAWLESGGSPVFDSAKLEKEDKDYVLETISRMRIVGAWIERFRITSKGIEKIEGFRATPPAEWAKGSFW